MRQRVFSRGPFPDVGFLARWWLQGRVKTGLAWDRFAWAVRCGLALSGLGCVQKSHLSLPARIPINDFSTKAAMQTHTDSARAGATRCYQKLGPAREGGVSRCRATAAHSRPPAGAAARGRPCPPVAASGRCGSLPLATRSGGPRAANCNVGRRGLAKAGGAPRPGEAFGVNPTLGKFRG